MCSHQHSDSKVLLYSDDQIFREGHSQGQKKYVFGNRGNGCTRFLGYVLPYWSQYFVKDCWYVSKVGNIIPTTFAVLERRLPNTTKSPGMKLKRWSFTGKNLMRHVGNFIDKVKFGIYLGIRELNCHAFSPGGCVLRMLCAWNVHSFPVIVSAFLSNARYQKKATFLKRFSNMFFPCLPMNRLLCILVCTSPLFAPFPERRL